MRPTSFVPFMLAVSGGLAVLAAAIGFVVSGQSGALGAAAGVAFITGVYVLSTGFLGWVERISRDLLLVTVLVSYIVKLFALLLVLDAVRDAGWPGLRPMIFGVVAGIVVWIVAQMWWLTRAKLLYVQLPERE